MKPSLAHTRQFLAAHLPRDTPGRVVGVLMAILAILLLANWITHLSAPRPLASLPETRAVSGPLSMEPVNRIFGLRSDTSPALANLVLTGVFAASDGTGFATFRVPGGQASALAGAEVMPGLTLLRVAKDHVVLRSAAGEQRLSLTKDKAAPSGAGEGR